MRLFLLAVAGLVDIVCTLLGQSAAYWAGDFSQAREGNPLAEPFLAVGPWVFAAAASSWLAFLVLLVHFWKHRIADGIALVAFAGHTFGGAAWMLNLLPYGVAFAVAYLAAMIAVWSRSIAGKKPIERSGEAG